ncbi:MAG TPA: hypothetical protein PK147_11560, partial [Saprospiraceae bacterium]|nr:hypothetical protein [Saprospiraceae bacterium]
MNDTSEIAILIDEFIRNPIGYHDEYLEKLIERKDFTKQHLFHLLNKLCSSQNGPIINKSGASRGTIGYLNRRSQKRRNEVFDKKLKSGFRSNSNNKVILAEGDSWFEYPIFIREILDYLTASRHSDYAIYSVAHGSDWLSNMIYENQYIEQIQHLSPDVFLISGGGNDLVGKMRIIEMIETPLKKPIYNDEFYADRSRRSQIYKIHSRVQFDEDKYNLGVEHLNKE